MNEIDELRLLVPLSNACYGFCIALIAIFSPDLRFASLLCARCHSLSLHTRDEESLQKTDEPVYPNCQAVTASSLYADMRTV